MKMTVFLTNSSVRGVEMIGKYIYFIKIQLMCLFADKCHRIFLDSGCLDSLFRSIPLKHQGPLEGTLKFRQPPTEADI